MLSADLVDNKLTMLWIELIEIQSPVCTNVLITSSGVLFEWQNRPNIEGKALYFWFELIKSMEAMVTIFWKYSQYLARTHTKSITYNLYQVGILGTCLSHLLGGVLNIITTTFHLGVLDIAISITCVTCPIFVFFILGLTCLCCLGTRYFQTLGVNHYFRWPFWYILL